jgi:hypothetical protein
MLHVLCRYVVPTPSTLPSCSLLRHLVRNRCHCFAPVLTTRREPSSRQGGVSEWGRDTWPGLPMAVARPSRTAATRSARARGEASKRALILHRRAELEACWQGAQPAAKNFQSIDVKCKVQNYFMQFLLEFLRLHGTCQFFVAAVYSRNGCLYLYVINMLALCITKTLYRLPEFLFYITSDVDTSKQ